MMQRTLKKAAIVAALGLLTLVYAAPVAGASPASNAQSCVNRLELVAAGSPEAKVVSSICFTSFARAWGYVTHGRVALPSDLRAENVTQAMVDAAASPTSVVLGIDWDGSSYTGANVVWEASNTCTTTQSWTVTYVGNTWNDRISSAKSYGGCHTFNHFEDGGFGGAVQQCKPNCSTMGVMNNQTSSLSWDY